MHGVLKIFGAIILGFIVVGALAGGENRTETATKTVTKVPTTGCRVTVANYNNLCSGMDYTNAVRTLSCSGREVSPRRYSRCAYHRAP
jgi:hypothetical protein